MSWTTLTPRDINFPEGVWPDYFSYTDDNDYLRPDGEWRKYVPESDIAELTEQIDHLRNMVESLWPKASVTMSETCVDTWIAELRELGVEVSTDGKN